MCQRQNPSVFGGSSPFLRKGEWQFLVQYRRAVSNLHYQGTNPYPILDANGPINTQNLYFVDLSYGLTRRFSLSLTTPIVDNSFAIRRIPPGGTQPEWQSTYASGLGDLSFRGNYWLFKAREPATWNVLFSAGIKAPTGAAGDKSTVFGRTVPVDISIQPGDKAWAPLATLYGYRQFPWLTVFGSANYMFNPRGSTKVPTFFGSLTNPNNLTYNSSHDQFVYQFGASIRAPKNWPTPVVAYRISGVPIYDVFGSSSGFRRPGTVTFFEPGLSYTAKGHTFTVTVPITTYVNVKDSPFSARIEDATVPRYALTVTYLKRFKP